jgi:hypothetical protein
MIRLRDLSAVEDRTKWGRRPKPTPCASQGQTDRKLTRTRAFTALPGEGVRGRRGTAKIVPQSPNDRPRQGWSLKKKQLLDGCPIVLRDQDIGMMPARRTRLR